MIGATVGVMQDRVFGAAYFISRLCRGYQGNEQSVYGLLFLRRNQNECCECVLFG